MEAEVPLLPDSHSRKKWRWRPVGDEMKRVSSIAVPMMVVMISQFLVRAAPLFMLGHLGELSLSSASIATSLCNATGFTVVFGLAGALETLCGQAYGAGQHEKLGTLTAAAAASLLLICVPISVIWIYAAELLLMIGQDPLIAAGAGRYALQLIPALFASAFLEPLVRFLQVQSLILPMFVSSVACLCIELPLCWFLVFQLDLGSGGAALSVAIASWLNVAALLVYVKYCAGANFAVRPSASTDFLAAVKDFFRIGVSSALMFCLEGWTYELIILLSGLLPNPQLETSIVTMCYMISGSHSYIPYSFGAAASTLVSNELGRGKAEGAKAAVYTVLLLGAGEFLLCSAVVYTCRGVIGYLFSENLKFVRYMDDMTPFICIIIIMDSLQNLLSGVVRGSGWQDKGAYVNLGAYYLVGIPVGLLLGFVAKMRGKGLLGGLVAGATVQALSLSIITYLTDWEKQAKETRHKVLGENFEDVSLGF